MQCPNPNCEREMRLLSGKGTKNQGACNHCGRLYPPPKFERFEFAYWKCDNCGASVWAKEELNLRALQYGAEPKFLES